MLARKMNSQAQEFDYDYNRIKNSVEGKGSETALTLSGPMTPEQVFQALMNVKLPESKVQSKRK